MGRRLSLFYLSITILAVTYSIVLLLSTDGSAAHNEIKRHEYLAFLSSFFFLLDSIIWWDARSNNLYHATANWLQRLRVITVFLVLILIFLSIYIGDMIKAENIKMNINSFICFGYAIFAVLYAYFFHYIRRHDLLLLGDLARAWRFDRPKADLASFYSSLLLLVAILELVVAVYAFIGGMSLEKFEELILFFNFIFLALFLIVSPLMPRHSGSKRVFGANCFLSYATEDKKFIEKIRKDLEEQGVTCFHDERDILSGDELAISLGRGIATSDIFIVLISEKSIRSQWVRDEIYLALHHENMHSSPLVMPIRNCDIQYIENWLNPSDIVPNKLRGRGIEYINFADENWNLSFNRLMKVINKKTRE